MKRVLLLIVALSLTSCIPPMSRQDQLNVYRKNCLDYGFQWGTREFAQCVKDQEYQDEKLAIERRKAQALEDKAWEHGRSTSYGYNSTKSHGYVKAHKMKKHTYEEVYPSNNIHVEQRVNQKVKQQVHNTTNANETHVHETHIHNTYQPEHIVVQQPAPAFEEPASTIPPAPPAPSPAEVAGWVNEAQAIEQVPVNGIPDAPPAPSPAEVAGWVNEAQAVEQVPVNGIPDAPPFPADLTFGNH